MSEGRPLPGPERRDRYDEIRYRESLHRLGLFPPVDREAIHAAYRKRARSIHPDRFQGEDEKANATRRIQEMNVARDYALLHLRGFQIFQSQAGTGRGTALARRSAPPRSEPWLLPVTGLYALATLVAALPFVVAAALVGRVRRAAWGARKGAWIAWRAWLALAPHLVLLVPALVGPPVLRAWCAGAVLVMGAADFATLLTGDPNALRSHRAVDRARALASRLAFA